MYRSIISILAAAFVTGLLAGNPAYAGFKKGVAAYKAKNYELAFKEFRKAADRGHAGAQHRLGLMYERGLGVTRNEETARKWYRLSAEQGNARGQRGLSRLLRKGLGGPQDLVAAYKWSTLALEKRSNKKLERWRGWIEKRLTSDEIAEAKRQAKEWRKRHPTLSAGNPVQSARAGCDFLPVTSVNCPASLSPQEAAFCGIWGEGYYKFANGKLPVCVAIETVDGETTIWRGWGQHTALESSSGSDTLTGRIKGAVLTASFPTRRGPVKIELRRDGDVLRENYTRNNRTSSATLPRFGN